MSSLEELLEAVVNGDGLECEECGARMDPDQEECLCGWTNPIRSMGLI